MKDYDINKELSYIQYWDVNNIYVWAIPFNLMKISYETIMRKVMKNIFLKLIFSILKNYMNFIISYHFYQEK